MTFVAAWLIFPLLVLATALGTGLLIERIGGHRLPGPLLVGVGFTGLVCVTQVITLKGATAPLAPVAVVVVAVLGYALGARRLRETRADLSVLTLGLVVFAAFAAPAAFTGELTFLGYSNLGDASIHFELVDRWMAHGPSVAGLAPSSFRDSVNSYFITSYPTGAHTVLGAARALTRLDVAWVFQPYLTVLATMAGLALQPIVAPAFKSRWLAAAVAGAAALSGLVYSYANDQQAIKELATVVCIVTAVGLVRPLLAAPAGWRAGLPLAVTVGGGLGVLSLAVAPWVGPLLVIAGIAFLVRNGRERPRAAALQVGAFAVVAGVLALPALSRLGTFVAVSNSALTGATEFGNLPAPLQMIQAFGVWPAPDFRLPLLVGPSFAYVAIGAAVLSALLGGVLSVRRRAWGVLLLAGISTVGFLAVAGRSSPWAYGKALMILSPAAVVLAAAGAAYWWEDRRRLEALALGVSLAIGLAWTDAQTYHGIDAAPHDRMSELAGIGERYAGQGPSMYFEFEEFAKHFLRRTDPIGAVEAYRPPVPAPAQGRVLRFGFSADVDDFDARSLADHVPLLVIRRGPTTSRPPSGYRRVEQGRFYDVWRRERSGPRILAHLPLGGRLDAAGTAPCKKVKRLADVARARGGQLAVAPRAPLAVAHLARAPAPRHWGVDAGDAETWRPSGQGRVSTTVKTAAGRFSVWLEASVGRAAHVYVDDREVGVARNELNPRLSTIHLGSVMLAAGRHDVRLDLEGGSPDPRNGGVNRLIGPVYLSAAADPGAGPLRTVAPADWRSLCGTYADWVEAVEPS